MKYWDRVKDFYEKSISDEKRELDIFGNPVKSQEPRLTRHNFKRGNRVVLVVDGRYIPFFTVKKDPNNPIWRTAEKGEILKILFFSTKTERKKNLTPEQADMLQYYKNKDGTYTITVDYARVRALDGSEFEIKCEYLRKAEKHEVFLAEMQMENNFAEEEE